MKNNNQLDVPLSAHCLNWHPSCGPLPKNMHVTHEFLIPEIKIEMVECLNGKPATPISIVVPTKTRKRPDICSGKAISLKAIKTHADSIKDVELSLGQHVVTMTTLQPKQWKLIHGAITTSIPTHVSTRSHLPTRTYTCDLSYPLSKIARITIEPYTDKTIFSDGRSCCAPQVSVGYLLWQLASAYRKIYRKHKQYGVWGHAIEDLYFENLKIKDNVVTVFIGS